MGTLERRTGGDSIIIVGRQKVYGERIIGADVFNGAAPDWLETNGTLKALADITPALRRGRFPFTRNTLDPTSETADSESITGDNAAVPAFITSRSGRGDWEFEVLPGDAIQLLMGWFNSPVPRNTDLAEQDIAGKFNISDGKIVPKNDDDNPLADWPGQVALDVGNTVTSIQINGQQRRSRSNKFNAQTFETVTPETAKFTSSKFYHQINEIILNGTVPGSITSLKFLPDTKKAELTLPAVNSVFPGWSAQMVKATLPYIAFDVIPNVFRLTVNQNGMRLLLSVFASYVQEGRTLQSPIHVAYRLPLQNTESTKRNILDVYGYDTTDFYPSYGTALAIGEPGQSLTDLRTAVEDGTANIVPITQLETTGTHNYTNAEGYTGDPVGGQPVTDENQTRTVNVNATIVHRTDISDSNNQTIFWQDRYFEGQYVPIIVQHYSWNSLGRQSMIESEFPNCKLTAVPNLPIEGSGQVNRQLAFQAYPKGSAKEIKMTFYSKHGFME